MRVNAERRECFGEGDEAAMVLTGSGRVEQAIEIIPFHRQTPTFARRNSAAASDAAAKIKSRF
jgi:hypothetical protein